MFIGRVIEKVYGELWRTVSEKGPEKERQMQLDVRCSSVEGKYKLIEVLGGSV